MGKYAFRFLIENDRGQHSSVFRLWTSKNDCYFGIRGTAGQHKYSFHESGQCQYGIDSEIRKLLKDSPSWSNKSRLFDVWNVKADLQPNNYEKLLELIVPYSQLDYFEINAAHLKNTQRFLCEKNKAASIGIFKFNIRKDARIDFSDDTVELVRLPLENGHFIVALFRLIKEEMSIWRKLFTLGLRELNNSNNINETKFNSINESSMNDSCSEIRIHLGYKTNDCRYLFEGSFKKIKIQK